MAITNVRLCRKCFWCEIVSINERFFSFQLNELCRLCLDPSEMLYKLDSDFCILVMESGASVTISDAMKYLSMDIKVVSEKPDGENSEDAEAKSEDDENPEPKPDAQDDPSLPKVRNG